MKAKTTFLVLSALFILLGNSLALAVSTTTSGELPSEEAPSGEISSGELPSGEIPSGEVPSGEIPSGNPITSGELPPVPSGEEIIPFYYEDMQKHWANYAASQLAARGSIIGEEIGDKFYYHPDVKMTRGDFMLFLLATIDSTSGETSDISFADNTSIPEYLLGQAKVAHKLKIIKGVGASDKIYLYPNKEITRAEAFVMINNALSTKSSFTDAKEAIKYSDSAKIPAWSLQSVKNLTGYKIIQGSSNSVNPSSGVTRGEAAELCYKLLKQIEAFGLASGDVK